ncbi:MAG: hypothetical protein FIB01_05540 [Gemmatimonadetes bacterium]|nr:hypothetical protein [Gemmatimonadota bacterium]
MSAWRELSRLPESPEYWQALQRRVGAVVAPVLAAQQGRERRIDRWLAGGVLAAAACVILLLLSPPPQAGSSLAAGLAPADPLARALLSSREPPAIGGLLIQYANREP